MTTNDDKTTGDGWSRDDYEALLGMLASIGTGHDCDVSDNACTVFGGGSDDVTVDDVADLVYLLGPGVATIGDALGAVMQAPAKVVFNDPATVVIDGRGGKRVAKCGHGDRYDRRVGVMVACSKYLGIGYEEFGEYEALLRMLSSLDRVTLAEVGVICTMASAAMEVAGLD